MKRILVFSRDPGGANTVIPLIQALKNKNYEVLLYGKDIALKKYSECNLTGKDITNKIKIINENNIFNFISELSPDFIITGTSGDDFTERFIWKASEILNIPSFAILDQWINYGLRFSNYMIEDISRYDLERKHSYLPSKILVMDEYAKQEIINEGISEKYIYVSGQPHFDTLTNKVNGIRGEKVQEFRRNNEINEQDILITFVSEPISKTYNETDFSEHYWGYSERTIFKEFLKILKKVTLEFEHAIKIIIKLHPKENEDNYDDYKSDVCLKNFNIDIKIDKESDSIFLAKSSDLVVGMSSMLLIEAAIIKKPVISVQMGLKRENPFILDRMNKIKSILNEKQLDDFLRDFILNKKYVLNTFSVENNATEKVIELMEEILWKN